MDMIERVAKAIEEVKGGMNYSYADFCRDAAIAAIKAMREPTPVMVHQGEGMSDFILDAECFDNSHAGRMAEMKMAYQVMIDTALAGEGKD